MNNPFQKTDIKVTVRKITWDIGKHIATLIFCTVMGIIGFLIAGLSGALVLFAFTFIISYLILLCFVPFAGIWFYWVLSNALADWLFSIAGIQNYEHLYIAKLIPIILYGIIGAILWVVMSVLGLIVIVALLGAIANRS